MMRAIVQNGYGTADVLRMTEIEPPAIKADEVLVRVHAAGVDRGTWLLMTGQPYAVRLGLGLRGPRDRVAGMDVAGTVVEVGAAVTRFAVGDDVFGTARGSFAELAAARQNTLALKPATLSYEEAAVVAVSGVTALQALRDVGRVRAGQHVLVIGASGGVGTYAVQLAKAFGAEVTGVCSTEKVDLVRSLGSDHVIDYRTADFGTGGHRYDLILDIGGDSSLTRLRRALTPRGTLVIVGGSLDGKWLGLGRQARAVALSLFVRQRLTMVIAKQRHPDMGTLAELIGTGRVAPVVEATYPLADAPEAVRHVGAGKTRGKVAIRV
ncbi:NADPH:quinone reductase-like Zn-dependent oxidoreductase [Catenulispora sp. MAP5-51]